MVEAGQEWRDAIFKAPPPLKPQEAPKPRRPTRPTLASKRRRLEEKSRRGAVKSLRKSGRDAE